MGLIPDVFYSLTYHELSLILEGHRERIKIESRTRRELAAWMLWWQLLPYKKEGSEPIAFETLMGEKPRKPRKQSFATSEDAARAFFNKLKAESK